MIKEVAIDPELLEDPTRALHLANQVGIHRARVLVSLPTKVWGRLFQHSETADVGLKPRKLKSYRNSIERLHRAAIKRAGVGPIGEMSWIEYAAAEHRREPLHAILSESEQPGAPVLDYEAIYDDDSAWSAETTFEVASTAKAILSATRLLLHNVEEVHVVDSYLDATPPYLRTLKAILTEIDAQGGRRLIWHVNERDRDNAGWGNSRWRANTESDLRLDLGRLLTETTSFGVVLHKPKSLHDRFLLTERGGISLGTGFAARGHDREPINAFLLSPDKAKKDLEKFRALSNGNIAFSVGGPAALRL